MAWDDIKVAKLKALWIAGKSCDQIASALGDGISRNAVIGKVHRLKYNEQFPRSPGFKNSPTHKKRKPRTAKPKSDASRRQWNGQRAERTPSPTPLVADLDALRLAQPHAGDVARKTLAELDEAHDCRWPVGDPRSADFGYCGLERVASLPQPYCLDHYVRSVQPISPKKQVVDASEDASPTRPVSETV